MPDDTTPKKRASRAAYAHDYYLKNRAKVLAKARAYRAKPENRAKRIAAADRYRATPEYKLRYGTARSDRTEAQYVALAGRPRPKFCEVCGRNDSRIHFDHCHTLGHFRGWLCGKCNTILGMADDNPDILTKLAAYLKRTSDHTPPQLTLPGI